MDKNFESHVEEISETHSGIGWEPPASPQLYADIIKSSNCTGVTFQGYTVRGGTEDCFDAVRGSDYRWSDCKLIPLGDHGVTIKGAIDGWVLEDTLFEQAAQDCEVELGQFDNYWFPGRQPTRNGVLNNISRSDGLAVRVRVWDAEKPTVLNSKVKVTVVPKIVWYPYFLFMYLLVRAQGRVTK